MLYKFLFMAGIFVLLPPFIYATHWIYSWNYGDNSIAWETCLESERGGHIKPGSCQCASELFDDFSHSYDWMDACDILENKLRADAKK